MFQVDAGRWCNSDLGLSKEGPTRPMVRLRVLNCRDLQLGYSDRADRRSSNTKHRQQLSSTQLTVTPQQSDGETEVKCIEANQNPAKRQSRTEGPCTAQRLSFRLAILYSAIISVTPSNLHHFHQHRLASAISTQQRLRTQEFTHPPQHPTPKSTTEKRTAPRNLETGAQRGIR